MVCHSGVLRDYGRDMRSRAEWYRLPLTGRGLLLFGSAFAAKRARMLAQQHTLAACHRGQAPCVSPVNDMRAGSHAYGTPLQFWRSGRPSVREALLLRFQGDVQLRVTAACGSDAQLSAINSNGKVIGDLEAETDVGFGCGQRPDKSGQSSPVVPDSGTDRCHHHGHAILN